jgi:hypothetical protein
MFQYCLNNPIIYLDDGNIVLEAIIIGAIAGGVWGATSQGIYNIATGRDLTEGMLSAGLGGAASGAIDGILPGSIFISPAVGGLVSTSIDYYSGNVTSEEFVERFAINTISNSIGGIIADAIPIKLKSKTDEGFIKTIIGNSTGTFISAKVSDNLNTNNNIVSNTTKACFFSKTNQCTTKAIRATYTQITKKEKQNCKSPIISINDSSKNMTKVKVFR